MFNDEVTIEFPRKVYFDSDHYMWQLEDGSYVSDKILEEIHKGLRKEMEEYVPAY
jgi:hypothetical protein